MTKARANTLLWVVILLVAGILSVFGVRSFMVGNFNTFIGLLMIISLVLVIAAVVITRRTDETSRK